MQTYNMASQACRQFVGCDGITPGHLAAPSSFEEKRAVRKLRFDILQPLRGATIGEGQRLRPRTVWLGLRLGQGGNTTWESGEFYDVNAMAANWGPNKPLPPGQTPARGWLFNPTDLRWNGRCMALPGQMQMNGAEQKWGHVACNMQAAYICEISPPGTANGTGGFNESTGMGPQQPGRGGGRGQGGGWNQGGAGGGGWNPNAGAGGRGQGAGGWNPQGGAGGRGNPQNPGQGGGRVNPQNPGQGGGRVNPQNPGQGGWNPQGGAGAGRGNTGQGTGQGRWNPQNPGQPQTPQWPQAPNQPTGGNPQRPFNPRPRLYQQGATP